MPPINPVRGENKTMKKSSEQSVQSKRVLRQSMAFIWQSDKLFVIETFLFSILTVFTGYIPVLVLSAVLDMLSTRSADVKSIIWAALLGLLVHLAMQLIQIFLNKAKRVRMDYISEKFETLVARKGLRMGYADIDSEYTKQARARIQADRSWGSGIYGVINILNDIVYSAVGAVVSLGLLVPLFAALFRNSALLSGGGVILAIVLLAALSSVYFSLFHNKREAACMQELTDCELKSRFNYMDMGGGAINYSAIKNISMYGGVPMIRNSIKEDVSRIRERVMKLSNIQTLGEGLKGLVSGIFLGLSYVFVAMCTIARYITLSEMTRSAQAIYKFADYISRLIRATAELNISADRLGSTLDFIGEGGEGEADTNDSVSNRALPGSEDITIELRNVSFTYPGSDRRALEDVSFTISGNKRIAVVGENGSGKTTLVKLLCGLYEAESGSISINGKEMEQYSPEAYRELFSVVFQDFFIFAYSLRFNVAAGRDYSDDRIIESLRKVGFDDRLAKMEKGINTNLYHDIFEDGEELSGGEAQRVAIARAICKEAPIVILDEPTAALDPVAEYEIFTKLNTLVEKRCAIYISHRLSSCRFCDEIFVLDGGHLVQRGSHNELLKDTVGKYYQLWNAQAQYYVEQC